MVYQICTKRERRERGHPPQRFGVWDLETTSGEVVYYNQPNTYGGLQATIKNTKGLVETWRLPDVDMKAHSKVKKVHNCD